MRRVNRLLAGAWLGAALAAPAAAMDLAECRALVAADAQKAREKAAQWSALGGGAAADLCAGEALAAQGALTAAARLLTRAGSEGASLAPADRLAALGGAGALWLEAGQPELAAKAFRAALNFDAAARGARLGLARLAAADGDFAAAEAELSAYLATGAADAEALAMRASARRALARPAEARADAEAATAATPTDPIAWYELGAAAAALGDKATARRAWIEAATLDAEGPGGALARRGIEALELGD